MAELSEVLEAHRRRDPAPRAQRAIDYVLTYPAAIASDAEGI